MRGLEAAERLKRSATALSPSLDTLLEERERWILWLGPAIGLGIGLYFALPVEPPLLLGVAGTLLGLMIAICGRRRAGALLLGLGLVAVGFGVAAAGWRSREVAAPILSGPTRAVDMSGRIVALSIGDRGPRLLLDRLRIHHLPLGRTPERLQISLRGSMSGLHVGGWVWLRGMLFPPPPPAAPGAFDFAREAYFERLGAVGFNFGAVHPEARPRSAKPDALSTRAMLWLNRLREKLRLRVVRELKGPEGGFAAALMTGDRSSIPPYVVQAMRNSGLAHLLVIAGLHLSFVAGILFFTFRFLFALVQPLALRFPTKKWAAVVVLIGAFCYLLLSGARVPTQRAFFMIAIVMLAVLLDRQAISMRLVSWAAIVILALQPESLLSASFEMSFAAVVALIAVYEEVGPRFSTYYRRFGRIGRGGLYLLGIALTTLVAGGATAPFAAYNFHTFNGYGVVANLIAVPITGFWIMPWALVTLLAMPFGLDRFTLIPMGWGIHAVIRVAETVSSLPGAVVPVAAMPDWGLITVAVGGLWLCLWRRPWRFYGVLAVAIGLASIWLAPRPDILIDGQAKRIAVRGADGGLLVSPGRGDRMAVETWLARNGGTAALSWPGTTGESRDGRLRCDTTGCTYRVRNLVVDLPKTAGAAAMDCRAADLVVSLGVIPGRCAGARIVIDRTDLRRQGATAIYLERTGRIRIESVNAERGRRPWSEPQQDPAGAQ